ncbi:MAG: UDP-2,3-diacylglucosamine diphosphatase [Bacteroidales bacterium]|nr:UDP-2,3-diacylglucosamine diphosphatase [Bacteroidales bacterium]
MSDKKIYFVSDAHFGSIAGVPSRENERRLVRWLDQIRSDCEALYLLGDMIDFWYEYKYLVPKGYARFFGKLAELTDAGIPVCWLTGNHDVWLYSYVQEELGVQVLDGPLQISLKGKSFFLDHGDVLGDPSRGTHFLDWMFHNRTTQWLFSHVLPSTWGIWLGLRWSRHSYFKRKKDGCQQYLGEDKEYLIRFAKDYAAAHPDSLPDFFVFGHRHIMLDFQLVCRSRVIILGDWIEQFSYGVFDGSDFSLETFE